MRAWGKGGLVLRYVLLSLTFVAAFHYNVVRRHLLHTRLTDGELARRHPLAAPYYELVQWVGGLGLATVWKMYSPVPRRLRVAEIYARRSDGRWVRVPFASMSRSYRASRSWWDEWLFDFKQARINYNLFIYHYSDRASAAYVSYLARRVQRELGFAPTAMRVIVREADIPPPDQLGNWRPLDADLTGETERTCR